MAKRRYFAREFKLQILEQFKSKSVVDLAKKNDIQSQIGGRKDQAGLIYMIVKNNFELE